MNNIHSLFPEPLGTYDLNRDITSTELAALKDQTWIQNMGNGVGLDKAVLMKKNLEKIRGFIEDCLKDYTSKVYAFTGDAELYLTQSWVNIASPGGHHHKHSHPNSIVSGTFYFEGNDTDQLEFHHPIREKGMSWLFHAKEYHEYNCHSWLMPATVGKLYLWNSTISHSVPELKGKNNRYSLSFNTFVRGTIGEKHHANYLILP